MHEKPLNPACAKAARKLTGGPAAPAGPTSSPTRTKAPWKPRIAEGDPGFFSVDGMTAMSLGAGAAIFRESGRAPVAELPCHIPEGLGSHPGIEVLDPLGPDALPKGAALSYRIVGGYNANAVEVHWELPPNAAGPTGEPLQLHWVMLRTFTGLQVKYPLPGKRPPLVFALADEDAYVYCDEPVCRECTFRCKQGFTLYAAIGGLGIVRVPLSPNRP